MKDLGEVTYILGIRIYRDRSQKVLGLRHFNMHDSKKGFVPRQHGMCLSKKQSPLTKEERDHMNKIPYCKTPILTLRSLMLLSSYALPLGSQLGILVTPHSLGFLGEITKYFVIVSYLYIIILLTKIPKICLCICLTLL